jgi:hemerythrin-like domain-containing protein
MNQIGFARESGPIAVMLSEHTAGRSHVRELWEMAQLQGPLTAGEVPRIIASVSEFVPLLSAHIGKEDNILYPMARSAIPDKQLQKLDADCESFERRAMAPGEVTKLHELAARLIAAYPADSKQFETIAAGFSCH